MVNTCNVPGCRRKDIELLYYGRQICSKCWDKHSNDEIDLKKVLRME